MNTTTLFPSNLVVSSNHEHSRDYLQSAILPLGHQKISNNPDLLLLDQSTGWGIDQIRQIKTFLSRQPLSHPNKIVAIFDAQNLNQESQNALLKTVEEPGSHNFLFIFTSSLSAILPTVISRCHLSRLTATPPALAKDLIQISSDLKENLSLSAELAKNKEAVPALLQEQLYLYQKQLITHPDSGNQLIIRKLIRATQMINANVDAQSALDFFFLS
jgi:DNA polymerase III delta prime subunit